MSAASASMAERLRQTHGAVKASVLAESVVTALCAYTVAVAVEGGLIRWVRPTEWELAWISDVVLAAALGVAVYLWRSLRQTREALAAQQRAELVVQTQLSLAADIQRRLLPSALPADEGFECAAALRSAGQIGGDYYDFVEIAPRVWLVLVADVSGKGIPAAMALGSLRSAFRTLAHTTAEPARLIEQLSSTLYEEWRGSLYVTCIAAAFDLNARTLVYTNAGHPAGVILGPAGTRYLTKGGPPAGLIPDVQFEQDIALLHVGDLCLLVSDGVTEALEAGEEQERELLATSARGGAASTNEICQSIMTRAMSGHGPADVPNWDDDRTVVVVRMRGRVSTERAWGELPQCGDTMPQRSTRPALTRASF